MIFNLPINEQQPKIDWVMLGALGGLMIIGVFFVFSATMVSESASQARCPASRGCVKSFGTCLDSAR